MWTNRRRFVRTAALGGLGLSVASLVPDSTANTPASIEPIIEPNLPIVDPHHHMGYRPKVVFETEAAQAKGIFAIGMNRANRGHRRYLLDEVLANLNSGHNVRATVYLEAGSMYRASGPEPMRSIGEVEFANGIAAMSASGLFGDARVCAAIVGSADLMLGDAVEDILRAHIRVGGGRYRGIRSGVSYDPDPRILGSAGTPHVLLDERFRAGFRQLHKLGLSFDVYLLEPQLPDLIDLAHAFPDTQIILNHVGVPLGVASYEGWREQRFPIWRDNMRALSKCENVTVKLGGLGTPIQGFKSWLAKPSFTSEQLAAEWKPYIESCIEAFGAKRCMFESDFPPDSAVCSYAVLWNVFKRLAAGASKDEKTALFSGTAARVYRLDI
jgi:L-fuconolactonase